MSGLVPARCDGDGGNRHASRNDAPPEWAELPVSRTADLRSVELVPGFEGRFKGAPFRTNRWGMRDREYTREKPPGTFRIAVLGSSVTMGSGVGDGETFESLAERALNERGGFSSSRVTRPANSAASRLKRNTCCWGSFARARG